MDNKEIIKLLKLTTSLLELHSKPGNDQSFKIRGYNNAIFNLERYDKPLSSLSLEEICKIDGIGKSLATTIDEIIRTGSTPTLTDLLEITPPGIINMLQLKGFGPKKIRTIWDELKIETIPDLLQACEEGRVRKLKGFGDKTEETIKQLILFSDSNQDKLLYKSAELLTTILEETLRAKFPSAIISTKGALRRKVEVLEKLEFLIGDDDIIGVQKGLNTIDALEQDPKRSGPFCWRGRLNENNFNIEISITPKSKFYNQLVLQSGTGKHLSNSLAEHKSIAQILKEKTYSNEEEVYEAAGLPYIVPELREGLFEFNVDVQKNFPTLLQPQDLKGVIHSHSTYSDGKHTLEDMALFCKQEGFEYLGISDHSQSAFYANGLDEFRVLQQIKEIESLNQKLAPFRTFKGIELDILNDGCLDYPDEILAKFDFVIASVHSNLKMDIVKATDRLIKAVSNPYTTILGHPTGRLLLRREGYPIDHRAVIDACSHYGVIIEINANPNRLDIDWRWIPYALEKNVMISINPDAHEKDTISHMKYGVYMARKGSLPKERNFNSLSVAEIEKYFSNRKEKIHLEKQ